MGGLISKYTRSVAHARPSRTERCCSQSRGKEGIGRVISLPLGGHRALLVQHSQQNQIDRLIARVRRGYAAHELLMLYTKRGEILQNQKDAKSTFSMMLRIRA